MKKTLLTATFLMAGMVGLMAQGLVGFDNNPYLFGNSVENGGTENYLVLDMTGAPVSDATWTAQLAYAGGQDIGTAIPFYGAAFPGVWAAGVEADLGVRTLNVPNGTASGPLVVKIFDGGGNLLATGPEFTHTPIVSTPPSGTDTLMLNFRGFQVPEPSTVALGVLGLGALLMFRRRK